MLYSFLISEVFLVFGLGYWPEKTRSTPVPYTTRVVEINSLIENILVPCDRVVLLVSFKILGKKVGKKVFNRERFWSLGELFLGFLPSETHSYVKTREMGCDPN